MVTLIENGTIVAFKDGEHRLLENGIIVFDEAGIQYVGKNYTGEVDERVDARGKLVTPGFINMHGHSQTPLSPHHLTVDVDGIDDYYQHAGIGFHTATLDSSREPRSMKDWVTVAKFSIIKRLLSGTTTFVEVGGGNKELVELTGEIGVRGYIAPGFRSAEWYMDDKGHFGYDWKEDDGLDGLDKAVNFIKKYDGSHKNRVKGMFYPGQVDTCSPTLLEETRNRADQLGVGIQIHVGQRLYEFQEILRRHRMTPVQFLNSTGLLGPDTVAGHCIFASGHSRTSYPRLIDQEILRETGTSIAYCPVVFTRNAVAMESFGRNIRYGINMTIGTDNFPQDIINEMRWASMLSKVVDFDRTSASSAEVFDAVTLNAAKALNRKDIGRLEKGAKADIVLIDLQTPRISPVYDPIKSLVNAATSDNVVKVYCDGKLLVENGEVTGVDTEKILKETQSIADKEWSRVEEWDWAGRKLSDFAPLSYKKW
jgi:cytosine/adenosine deaminase-related metal-dependent hydrolase